MQKTFFLAVLVLFLIGGSADALTLEEGVQILPSGSNTTYEIDTTISLNTFDVESNAPYFNGYIFQIEPYGGTATVMINSWNPPTMEFEVTATDETSMVLGGFAPSTKHGIYVDGAYWRAVTANVFGTVSFTYPHFSTHIFSFGTIPLAPSGSRPKPSEVEEVPEIPEPKRVDILPWVILCVSVSIIILVALLLVLERKKSQT